MAKANYFYQIKEVQGLKCIVIVDQNEGGMSVTNDIENVVAEIGSKENIDPARCPIIYQDSDMRWDGWDAFTGNFVSINERLKTAALDKAVRNFKYSGLPK